MNHLGCTNPGAMFLGPPDPRVGVISPKIYLDLLRVDVVLRAKFQRWGFNGVAANREQKQAHRGVISIASGASITTTEQTIFLDFFHQTNFSKRKRHLKKKTPILFRDTRTRMNVFFKPH